MKRLLILGGSRYILPVIKTAHNLGIYVITCDYLPNNIAHKYSDEYVNLSIIDKEKILRKARELNIDGIMSFACDPGVETAAYVSEKLNLPSPGPYKSVEILQNKGKFRKFLKENGFNVPIARAYNNVDDALEDIQLFNWPIIVKPTDSAGSKGVKRVDKKKDLKDAIDYALKFSHSNEFIIEDFLEKKGYSSDCDSFSIDGKMVLWGFNSQHFDKNAINPYTPAAYSWPASISSENINYLKSEIQRLLDLLEMKTSVFNIEVRECVNGKPYIMELTPRGGGNRLSEMMKIVTGTNIIENAVRYSVGMPLVSEASKPMEGYLAEVILHSNHQGQFKELIIDESINNNILEKDLWVSRGDYINEFSGANETIGTVVLKFNSENDLCQVLNNIDQYIKVIVR